MLINFVDNMLMCWCVGVLICWCVDVDLLITFWHVGDCVWCVVLMIESMNVLLCCCCVADMLMMCCLCVDDCVLLMTVSLCWWLCWCVKELLCCDCVDVDDSIDVLKMQKHNGRENTISDYKTVVCNAHKIFSAIFNLHNFGLENQWIIQS